MLLAELVLVMVPTSVEYKRLYDKELEKSPVQLASAIAPHSVCKGVQSKLSVGSLPYPEAIGAWLDARTKHGRNGLMKMVAVREWSARISISWACALRLNLLHLVARPCNSVCGAHRAYAGRPQAGLTFKA